MKKIILILGVILAALWLAELFLVHAHATGIWWRDLKGYAIVMGVLGGMLLMFIAKTLGKYWLYRKEDYYD